MSDDKILQTMRKRRKNRHKQWFIENTKVIEKCNFLFTRNGENYIFRERNMPKVDFYPHTGRWRDQTNQVTHSGGANKFLQWYAQQGI